MTTGNKNNVKTAAGSASTRISLDTFIGTVIDQLEDRGLSRPWADAMVETDLNWIKANFHVKTVDEVADELFHPDIPSKFEEYRECVALFLDRYGLETDHTEAVLDKRTSVIKTAHKGKLPSWSVAAQLLHEARDIAAYTTEERPDDGSLSLDLSDLTKKLLEQAVQVGLMGNSIEEVAITLVHQGLLGLMRDGLLQVSATR